MSKNMIIFISIAALFFLLVSLYFIGKLPGNEGGTHSTSRKSQPNTASSERQYGLSDKLVEIDFSGESMDSLDHKYKQDEFQAGMNVLVYGQHETSEVKRIFKQLRELGVNSIAIAFPFFQDDWQSSYVRESPTITPTITELKGIIEEAHGLGLSVMLRPMLDEQTLLTSGYWRGQIEPANPQAWFQSYRELMLNYAELAESTNVALLNIGTELNSLQNKYSNEWRGLIEDLRDVYQGELIYSFNWDTVSDIATIEFVELLDHVGIDAYFPLDIPNGADVVAMEEAWTVWTREFEQLINHDSVVITEAGIIPIAGAYRHPYAWSIPNGKLDWKAQEHYYEATYRAWKPMIEGMYWWSVTLGHNSGDIDYSPLGSPTETVIKTHFLN